MIRGLAVAVAIILLMAVCGEAATGWTLYVRSEDDKWVPQKPPHGSSLSLDDCMAWAVRIADLNASLKMKNALTSCIADDHHIAYVYNGYTGRWTTVTP